MQAIYLVESLRPPLEPLGGQLAELPAPWLAAAVIKGLLEMSVLIPDAVAALFEGVE